jgi:hypothetical protein
MDARYIRIASLELLLLIVGMHLLGYETMFDRLIIDLNEAHDNSL